MSERASLSRVVSDRIRGDILEGKFKPGERLVEDRLSAELGVSRVPVREALRGLSMEGLVRLEPNRGATVIEVTPVVRMKELVVEGRGLPMVQLVIPRSEEAARMARDIDHMVRDR